MSDEPQDGASALAELAEIAIVESTEGDDFEYDLFWAIRQLQSSIYLTGSTLAREDARRPVDPDALVARTRALADEADQFDPPTVLSRPEAPLTPEMTLYDAVRCAREGGWRVAAIVYQDAEGRTDVATSNCSLGNLALMRDALCEFVDDLRTGERLVEGGE